MAQGGNAWEWNETALDGINDQPGEYRVVRGGVWNNDQQPLDSSFALSITSIYPEYAPSTIGFRVASSATLTNPTGIAPTVHLDQLFPWSGGSGVQQYGDSEWNSPYHICWI